MTQVVDPREVPDWNSYLASHPAATIFHSREWCDVLASTYRYVPQYVVHSDGGKINGCLPVLEVNSVLTGRRGVSLPFTDECNGLAATEALRDLHGTALSLGKRRGWKYFEVRGTSDSKASIEFFSHSLRLGSDQDGILRSFSGGIRTALRKAQNAGLAVSIGSSEEAVRDYYRLHELTRKRHGLPPQPVHFFENIYRFILSAGLGFVVLARSSGKLIAGAVFFCFRGKAIYKFGASDYRFQELRPNNLVMWEGIKELLRQKQETLSFGRTSLNNNGLRRFKLGWGTSETTLSYTRFDISTGEVLPQRDNSSGSHSAIFRFLPLWTNRLIGSFVYPHLG